MHAVVAGIGGIVAFVVVWTFGADIITFDLYVESDATGRRPRRYLRYVSLAVRSTVLIWLAAATAPLITVLRMPYAFVIPLALVVPVLLIKAFQPHSVAVYFSARMQDAHARYRSGTLAELLAHVHRDMTPLAFEHWYLTVYEPELMFDHWQRRRQKLQERSSETADEIQSVVLFALNESTLNPVREERRLLNA